MHQENIIYYILIKFALPFIYLFIYFCKRLKTDTSWKTNYIQSGSIIFHGYDICCNYYLNIMKTIIIIKKKPIRQMILQ
jgi:hypothetical protein